MRGKKAKLLRKLAHEATKPQPTDAPTHKVLRNRKGIKVVKAPDGTEKRVFVAELGTLEHLPTTERGMYLWLKKKHS